MIGRVYGVREAQGLGDFYTNSHRIEVLGGLITDPFSSDAKRDYDSTVFIHELAGHFWPHLSSPYGLYLWRLNVARLTLLVTALQILREEEAYKGKVRTPIRRWAAEAGDPKVRSTLSDLIERWDLLARHEEHLEGGFGVGNLNIGDVVHDWWFSLHLISAAFDKDVSALNDRPFGTQYTVEVAAAPKIPVPPDKTSSPVPYGIGAEAVSEGFALGQEADFLHFGGGTAGAALFERRWNESPVVPYKVVWGYVDSVASGESEIVGTWVKAIADLALCGPIDIHQVSRDPGPLCWEDIHPGWRFARAITAAKELGLLVGPSRIGPETGFDYTAVVGQICSHLGWTPPWDLCEKARFLSHSGLPEEYDIPIIALHETESWQEPSYPSDNRRFMIYFYKTASELRRQLPDAVVFPLTNHVFLSALLKHLTPFHLWSRDAEQEIVLAPWVPPEILAPLFGAEDWSARLHCIPGTPIPSGEAPAKESLYFGTALSVCFQLVEQNDILFDPPEDTFAERVLEEVFQLSEEDIEASSP